jgi:hypothetical protein
MSLIKDIPVAGAQYTVPVEFHPCDYADVVQWQRQIHQPFIQPLQRIGSDWNWPALFLGCHTVEQMCGRQALAFQMRVANQGGDAVPIAQVILSLPYYWPKDVGERCVFIWFVAASPSAALKKFGITDHFSCLKFVIDTAVQVSIAHGMDGRIGLHAALGATKTDSDALMKRYKDIGLSQRKKWTRFFRFPFRKDDERLFYFDAVEAQQFSQQWDHFR